MVYFMSEQLPSFLEEVQTIISSQDLPVEDQFVPEITKNGVDFVVNKLERVLNVNGLGSFNQYLPEQTNSGLAKHILNSELFVDIEDSAALVPGDVALFLSSKKITDTGLVYCSLHLPQIMIHMKPNGILLRPKLLIANTGDAKVFGITPQTENNWTDDRYTKTDVVRFRRHSAIAKHIGSLLR